VNKKPKNIEQLYSESFNNFRVEPSSGLWKSISSKLAWRNFFTFTPTTLNAYYVTAILAFTTTGVLLLTKPAIENNQETKEITINKTTETPVITTIQKTQAEPNEVTTQKESRKLEAGSRKQEIKSQKPVPGTQDATSSTIVVTKVDTQKLSSSAIVTTKTETQESISSIKHISPSTQNPVPSTHKLATPHLKPHTQNPTSNQKPVTSPPTPGPTSTHSSPTKPPLPHHHPIPKRLYP